MYLHFCVKKQTAVKTDVIRNGSIPEVSTPSLLLPTELEPPHFRGLHTHIVLQTSAPFLRWQPSACSSRCLPPCLLALTRSPSHHPCPVVLCFSLLCAFQDLGFCNFLLTCSLLPAVTFCLTSAAALKRARKINTLLNTAQVLEQDLTHDKDSMTICQIKNFQIK